MFGEPEIERGDKIGKSCNKCGERFTRVEGEDENVSRCKDCYERYQEIRDKYDLAAGTWVCRNEDLREAVQNFVEQEFDIHTYTEGSTVYFFE